MYNLPEDPHGVNNRVAPENTNPLTIGPGHPVKEKMTKKLSKFYKVEMCSCRDNVDSISIPYAIYYFYTAPVTKFWVYLVSFISGTCIRQVINL